MKTMMHMVVAVLLLCLLIFGAQGIRNLNSDAREIQLSSVLAQHGQTVSTNEGCVACHTVDGSPGIGPTWLGMFGRTEILADGSTVIVDEGYFRESIRYPAKQLVAGYPNVMLRYFLTDEDIEALIAFAQQLAKPQE